LKHKNWKSKNKWNKKKTLFLVENTKEGGDVKRTETGRGAERGALLGGAWTRAHHMLAARSIAAKLANARLGDRICDSEFQNKINNSKI